MTKLVRKIFMNKNTKQLSVTIPKKQIKATNPTIKFDENLFVRLEVFNKKKGK